MKNSPKHNPAYTHLPFKPDTGFVSLHSRVSVAIAYAGIRASTHMFAKTVERTPPRPAEGHDELLKIDNQLVVKDDKSASVKSTGHEVGTEISDSWITTKVKATCIPVM